MRRLLFRIEAAIALAIAWGLVFIVPLRMTARLFGIAAAPARGDLLRTGEESRARAVVRRMESVAERLPWRTTCLVQALAGSLLLHRRRIAGTTVRFGVRKTGGRIEAHAWLLLGQTVLTGGRSEVDFLPLADLGRPPRG